jgi:hypothetical protein
MRLFRTAALVAIGLAAALGVLGPAMAQPMGLRMGASLTELRTQIRLRPEGHYEYSARALPGVHPAFAAYRLLVTPTHGLCKITAWTSPVRTDMKGDEIRQRFEILREALTDRYGAGMKYDLLREGSLWHEPADWMVALQQHERDLFAVWTDENNDLPGHVAKVQLRVNPMRVNRAQLQLGYEFENGVECTTWIQDRKNRSL